MDALRFFQVLIVPRYSIGGFKQTIVVIIIVIILKISFIQRINQYLDYLESSTRGFPVGKNPRGIPERIRRINPREVERVVGGA